MDNNFRKLNIHFDIDALKKAYDKAVEDIGFSGEMSNCISLNHMEDGSADARGIFWMKGDDYEEVQIERFVNETAYKVFEPLLLDSYLKNVYDVLSRHYKLGRIRILKLDSRSTLSYHRDPENRLHIPIITNPGALMLVKNENYHMPADGSVYFMNTKAYHSAMNGGSKARVHIVATILGESIEDDLYECYGGD
jgi:hypothetical protein